MTPKLLILEDDVQLAKSLAKDFTLKNYNVVCAKKISEIPDGSFDYAIVDLRLDQGDSGLNAIETIKNKSPQCRVVVLTGYGSISTAVEAVKKGAVEYLSKPIRFKDLESVLTEKKVADFNLQEVNVAQKPPSLSEIENNYIDYILLKNKGNITKAAKDLGLHRQSLQRKLRKYT